MCIWCKPDFGEELWCRDLILTQKQTSGRSIGAEVQISTPKQVSVRDCRNRFWGGALVQRSNFDSEASFGAGLQKQTSGRSTGAEIRFRRRKQVSVRGFGVVGAEPVGRCRLRCVAVRSYRFGSLQFGGFSDAQRDLFGFLVRCCSLVWTPIAVCWGMLSERCPRAPWSTDVVVVSEFFRSR